MQKKYTVPEFVEINPNAPYRKGTMWCPYEGKWQMFTPRKFGEGFGYPRCEGCNISTEDWYVKLVNGIWKDEMGITRGKK